MARRVSSNFYYKAARKVLSEVRADFFRHVNHLCLRFHRQHHSGELFSYLFGSPLLQVQNYFQQFIYWVPGALGIVVSTIIWVGTWDWILTSLLVVAVVTTAWLMHRTRMKIQKLHSEYQKTETSVAGYVADLLRGSRDVKLYAMEDKVATDFDERVWQIGVKSYKRDVRVAHPIYETGDDGVCLLRGIVRGDGGPIFL